MSETRTVYQSDGDQVTEIQTALKGIQTDFNEVKSDLSSIKRDISDVVEQQKRDRKYMEDGMVMYKEVKSNQDKITRDMIVMSGHMDLLTQNIDLKQKINEGTHDSITDKMSNLAVAFTTHTDREDTDRRKLAFVLVGAIITMLVGFSGIVVTLLMGT